MASIKSPASRLFTQAFIQWQINQTSKLRVTGLCEGNSPVTSIAENVSTWRSHHIWSIVVWQLIPTHHKCTIYQSQTSRNTYLQYSVHTLNKFRYRVAVTISIVRFYQWGHAVTMNQQGPLLSVCRKLNSLFSQKKNPRWTHEASNSHTLLTISWTP